MEPNEYEANVVDSTTSKDPIPLPGEEIKLPLEDEKLKELQQKDAGILQGSYRKAYKRAGTKW